MYYGIKNRRSLLPSFPPSLENSRTALSILRFSLPLEKEGPVMVLALKGRKLKGAKNKRVE
jgi:hypothetical protein